MATLFLNDFYTIGSTKTDPGKSHLEVQVHLNRDHLLFAGHFPDHPVVPGVVMIQMITEILSDSLQNSLELKELDRVKFLFLVDPAIHNTLEFELIIKKEDQQSYHVTTTIRSQEQLILQCKGKWEQEPVN